MATSETWTPSRRLRAAAAAERERIERELARLGARERGLTAELAEVQAARADLEQEQHVLDRFAHEGQRASAPHPRLRHGPEQSIAEMAPNRTTPLRGARIRETAVRVLAANTPAGTPVHYRDWFDLMTAHGFMPAGKDPLASFLTQIGRSPLVQRTTTSGMYVLDLEFPRRARERLKQLSAELSEMRGPAANSTVEEIAATRERRAVVTAELRETERQLEEALRALDENDR